MLLQAGNVVRGSSPSAAAAATKSTTSLLLSENQQLMGGPPSLMEKLTIREREIVLKQGRRKVLSRGQTIFSQGAKHDGIFLIESGRIRVFYSSPLGREITLAYWHAGNFVGGPEVFDTGIHQWSGVASSNCSIVQLPGKELRMLAVEIPNLAIGLIEGLRSRANAIRRSRRCWGRGRSRSGSPISCCTSWICTASRIPMESLSPQHSPTPTWRTW